MLVRFSNKCVILLLIVFVQNHRLYYCQGCAIPNSSPDHPSDTQNVEQETALVYHNNMKRSEPVETKYSADELEEMDSAAEFMSEENDEGWIPEDDDYQDDAGSPASDDEYEDEEEDEEADDAHEEYFDFISNVRSGRSRRSLI